MNNKFINERIKKNSIISYKRERKKIDFRSDPNPLFPEVDPRIRIQIKMKWIHNTNLGDWN